MSKQKSFEIIKAEENANYLSVLLRIIEDANEKARRLNQEVFCETSSTTKSSTKNDSFLEHSLQEKREMANKKKPSHLIKVLQKELGAERARELRILQCGTDKEKKKIELKNIRERCESADGLMRLLVPGSNYVDYLAVVVDKSNGVNWGKTAPPPPRCEVCDPLSNLPLSVRKSYRLKSKRKS